MKLSRHSKIIELINAYPIGTQEELADYLNKEGFKVTQATVSRDIRNLKLTKVPGEDGKQRYALRREEESQYSERYIRVLRTVSVISGFLGKGLSPWIWLKIFW